MKLRWPMIAAGAACAACCAPLLLPLLAGTGLAGVGAALGARLSGLCLDDAVCIGLAAAAGGVAIYFVVRSLRVRKAKSCDCETSCAVGGCDLPYEARLAEPSD